MPHSPALSTSIAGDMGRLTLWIAFQWSLDMHIGYNFNSKS